MPPACSDLVVRLLRATLMGAPLLVLAGCALPGFPARPAAPVVQAAPAAAPPGWWTQLHDPAVDALAQAALAD